MLFPILILLFIIFGLFLFMPINLLWSKKLDEKSVWEFTCPLAHLGSSGCRILWFTIKKEKTKKFIGKSRQVKKQQIVDGQNKKHSRNRKEKSNEKSSGIKIDFIWKIYQQRAIFEKTIHAFYIFLKRIALSFDFDKSNYFDMKLSLEHPDELGIVCSILYPVIYSSAMLKWVHFEADFKRFENNAKICGKICFHTKFYNIIVTLLILIWKLPKIELYKFWRENRKKK